MIVMIRALPDENDDDHDDGSNIDADDHNRTQIYLNNTIISLSSIS